MFIGNAKRRIILFSVQAPLSAGIERRGFHDTQKLFTIRPATSDQCRHSRANAAHFPIRTEQIRVPSVAMMKKSRPKLLSVVKALVEWRQAQGLSQSKATDILADAGVRITLDSLQNWEIGRRSPTGETALALHAFLSSRQPAPISSQRRIETRKRSADRKQS